MAFYKNWKTYTGDYYNLYRNMLNQNQILIAGATGSGKSTVINGLLHTIMVMCPPGDDHLESASVILCDPKYGVELNRYRVIPHCIGYGDTCKDILNQLEHASAIMERRFHYMKRKGLNEFDRGHLYVFIDEYADLILSELSNPIQKVVQHLLEQGRAAHVHCVIATQWPSRKCITAAIKVNCSCCLALRCDTSIESKQIINSSGAEMLPKYGEGIIRVPSYPYEHVTVPLVDANEIQKLIKHWVKQKPIFLKTKLSV